MSPDWLLVETLGAEPAVVAQGRQATNMVPISDFLRRHPHLMAIQTAIGETVQSGKSLSSLTAKSDRVIRTEVVRMSDGRIHGVHVWIGPLEESPPERPTPGPLKWDLTNGVATDTPESLLNNGMDPSVESTQGRAFAEDLPARDLDPGEAKVLAMAIKPVAGRTVCSTWDVVDHAGQPITVGFAARVLQEADDAGRERLICRAMNWRSIHDGSSIALNDLGQRMLTGQARPGVHRALVDGRTWKLLKWLDEPCPFYDWHAAEEGVSVVHPDDQHEMAFMATQFDSGATARVLRLRAYGGGWTPVHVTAHRVKIDEDAFAGLLSLRLPTEVELKPAPPSTTRRARARVGKTGRST